MKRISIGTAAAAAFIWTAAPALAQSGAGSAGAPGSQAGSSQRPGSQDGQDPDTHDPTGQAGPTAGTEADRTGSEQTGEARDRGDRAHRDLQQFVERAAIANMAEVQLGQLGADRAQHPEVKQFAQMIVDEYTAALEQLRAAATSQGFELPTELDAKHRRIHEKLSEVDGDRFDREFMKAMVDTHKNTEKLLKKRAGKAAPDQAAMRSGTSEEGPAGAEATGAVGTRSEVGDTDQPPQAAEGADTAVGTSGAAPASADQWAAMTLPKVQSHLEQARSLEQQVKQSSRRENDKQNENAGEQENRPQQ